MINIPIENYNYPLPSERIAKYPLNERDHSKLLHYTKDQITDHLFKELPELIPANAMLLFNNTKVIRARLPFRKDTGAQIEIFCLEPSKPADIALAFEQTVEVSWNCMIGNSKKWKSGVLEKTLEISGKSIQLKAEKNGKTQEGFIIRFSWNNPDFSFSELMEHLGKTPVPPYLERESEEIDKERYQTIYSLEKGSVAAPTAGLHFTEDTMDRLGEKGISLTNLTLHVGAGTFRPVKSETIDGHEMHTETFRVSVNTLKAIRKHEGPKIAVGTTSLRTLESLYWAGVLKQQDKNFHHIEQWTPYQTEGKISFPEALDVLIQALEKEGRTHFEGSTAVIIVPGYTIRSIDALITNYHQPRSTLLLLVAALVGDDWEKIYSHALNNNYRFLSYGDSSLLWRSDIS